MEITERTLTGRQLKARLVERGVTMTALARAAGMVEPEMSAILAGRDRIGPLRRARIEAAIVALGLHRDDPPELESVEQPVFRIKGSE